MKFFIVLTSFLAVLANGNFAHGNLLSNYNSLNQTLNIAKGLRSFPEFNTDAVVKGEIRWGIDETQILQRSLLSILSFQSNIESNPDPATSSCAQLQAHLIKIQSNVSINQVQIQTYESFYSKFTGRISLFQTKNLTATGNYVTIYTRLVTIFTTLANVVQDTFGTLNSHLAVLQSNEEVVGSEVAICNNPCGTFLYYNTYTDITAPQRNGIVGGVNQADGSPAYVGFAGENVCGNELLTPCSVSTSSNSPGCNVPCGSAEIYARNSSYFLQNHSNLTWIATNSTGLLSLHNAVRITGPNNFLIGRTNVNGQLILGKVQAAGGIYEFQTTTSSGSLQLTNQFEVLVCDVVPPCPNITSTTPPVDGNFVDELIVGDSIVVNGSPISMNGTYEMVLLPDGNLVIRSRFTGAITWQTYTAGSGAVRCTMQPDGILALTNATGHVILSSELYSIPVPGSQLKLLNNGHFIIYNGNQISYSSEKGSMHCGTTLPIFSYDFSFGFNSGVFYDGSLIYPGSAMFDACDEFTAASITSSGANTTCSDGSLVNQATGEFFYNHPDLRWVVVTAETLNSDGTGVFWSAQDKIYTIRKNISSPTRGNFSQIGKFSNQSASQIYWNGDEVVTETQGTFEVLSCVDPAAV